MAQYMIAVATHPPPDGDADERMITSPDDLIDHLAHVVHRLDKSEAFSRITEVGPLRIRLTLHGAAGDGDIFDAFPLVRRARSSKEATRSAKCVDFAINIIDGGRCGVKRPRLKWRASDFGLKRLVPGWSDTERTTYFLRGECGLAVADWRSRHAYVWAPSIEVVIALERAAPFRWIIDGLAQRSGLMTMHAAAVGEGGVGLLIVGEGGRGKSTLALAAIGAGMDYLADDYCLVDAQPPYHAYRLFNTAKMRVDSGVQPDWIAGLEHEMEPGSGGKRIFNLARHTPGRLAETLEIRALLLPEFTDDALADLAMARPNEAFRRAAPSTVALCVGSEAQAVTDIGRLARTLPAYRIRMPRDPRRSIDRIRDLIATLRPSQVDASW
jgi:hypothetical protein